MLPDLLHKHAQFADLIRIVVEDQGIAPALVEKDYWIMPAYVQSRTIARPDASAVTSVRPRL